MRSINLIAFFLLLFFSNSIAAYCPETKIGTMGKLLISKKLTISNKQADAEFAVSFRASAHSSWASAGSEAAVVSVYVNDIYHQDIILFGGKSNYEYKALIGKLKPGKYTFKIFMHGSLSARDVKNAKIEKLSIKNLDGLDSDELLAIKYAPMIYARPETIGKFSDIPLLSYYEIFKTGDVTKVIYTTIFSNEDGGTPTAALMARWGRLTDIEWVYEVDIKDGNIVNQIFQGANHVTTNFRGKTFFGDHPVMYNATVNNNFADTGCSTMRTMLLPIKADLSNGSRETVMDASPFTYQIMADEAVREGRIDPTNMDINRIDNLQNYRYVEVFSDNQDAAVYIELETTDGKVSRSDLDEHRLRAERSGFKRIAVRMPSHKPLAEIRAVCKQDPRRETGKCRNVKLIKYIELQDNYTPNVISNSNAVSSDLVDNGSIKWKLTE